MQQAGIGAGYIKNILIDRIETFISPHRRDGQPRP